ncbi:hypothetical protein ACFYY8_05410 [Streptosporangium sp. NPDC001559]|uniref:hypothetical protein n=1 Tax=Streptosporangium sp. NPDC001559 TaxID=3366187 RepID=UPI0036EAECA3
MIAFLYMAAFGTLLYFLTVYFQSVHGYGAMRTGLAFLVPMLAIAAGSQAAGRLATRHGLRPVLLGSLAIGAAIVAIVAVANSGLPAAPSPGAVIDGLQAAIAIAVAGIALTALVALRLRRPR